MNKCKKQIKKLRDTKIITIKTEITIYDYDFWLLPFFVYKIMCKMPYGNKKTALKRKNGMTLIRYVS